MPVIAQRIPKPDDIYIVVTHENTYFDIDLYPELFNGLLSFSKFHFFVGTKQQLEQLQIPKQSIVAVRLSPLFLRPELKLFTTNGAQKLGELGYEVYDAGDNKKVAISEYYFPKKDVDHAFNMEYRHSKLDSQIALKGLGAYLEAITIHYLQTNKGITDFKAPYDSAFRRERQLARGDLELGQSYNAREWNNGMGKIIRRRVNIPK
jgi:hypothetical protein